MSKKILFTSVITTLAAFTCIAFASCESVGVQQQNQRLTVVKSEVTTVSTEVTTTTTKAANHVTIGDCYVLQMGQTSTEAVATATTEAVSYETTSETKTSQYETVQVESNSDENSETTSYYTIQSGDCISLIAEKLNCYEFELAISNPNLDWNYIQPGDQIVIPSGTYYNDSYYTDYSDNDVSYNNDWNGDYQNYSQPEYLSSITLYSAPDAASWNNIEVSMGYLNGLTLAPGEYFNWDSYIGWATIDNSMGYQDAPVLVGTETGYATGGGVCVTSTALMQAARAAGMDIIEKHDHSRNVSYAQPGDEASVSYGSANLVFANTTGRTVTFNTSCSYGTVTISCYAS